MRNSSSDVPNEGALGRTLAAVVTVLDGLAIRWTLAGALAADRYRASHRYTADADLLIVWDDRLPEALAVAGFELNIAHDEGEVHLIRARGAQGNVDLIVAGTRRLGRGLGLRGPVARGPELGLSRQPTSTARSWITPSRME